MALATGNIFKVIWVPTYTQYDAIVTKDVAAAYFVADVKKIYVNGVAYGFSSEDITSTLLANIIEVADTNSIDMTVTNAGGKLTLSGAIKLAGSNKNWVATTEAEYNASTNKLYEITDLSPDTQQGLLDTLQSLYPALNQPANAFARGRDDIVPFNWWYAKISFTGGSLLQITGSGLTLDKSVIDSIIDDEIQSQVLDKLGAANGIATLGGDGKVPASQLPGFVDDIIDVIIRTGQSASYSNTRFALLADGAGGANITPTTGKLYNEYSGPSTPTNKIYRWSGSVYAEITTQELKTLTIGDNSPVSIVGSGSIVIDQRPKWTVVT